jgi:alkylation response protein AidB-like acyl-CoA dehydrogenase
VHLGLTAEQDELATTVRGLCTRMAGAARARETEGTLDRALLEGLARNGFLDVAADGGSSLDALLVVEEAERSHANAPVAARALVTPAVIPGPELPASESAIGLVDLADPTSLVRYAGHCDTYLILNGFEAWHAPAAEVNVTVVPTRWGYPLGRVALRGGTRLGPGSAAALRAAWQVALAAEMGAAMRQAVALTARYVSERKQFGRPIASFQAVSHRLARAAVEAEGATWLARRAAADMADHAMAATAAAYAAGAARLVAENTHQVSGAIGITREYDLVLSTMRLGVLSSELGGAGAHALDVAGQRWPSADPALVPG